MENKKKIVDILQKYKIWKYVTLIFQIFKILSSIFLFADNLNNLLVIYFFMK